MFLDPGGHFAVIVVSNGKARGVAYFGTYTINEANKTMTMHIDANVGGGGIDAAGRDETRHIELSGNDLILQNETPSGAPGKLALTWKKAD